MSWGLVAVSGATAGIGIAGSNEATARGKIGAKKSFKQMKKYLENAQGIISGGYKKARDITTEKSAVAQTYQDPYVEIGLKAKDYFTELDKPGNISKKYKEYLSVGDPLFDYANKQTSDALQKRLSALGRSDSGAAIEEDLDRSTKIAYQFSDLADRRVQQEIGLQERMLGRGQQAAGVSTQLQYNTGQALSNLFSREADINAAYEAQIGGAAANYESTRGNLEMTNIGNITQQLQGGLSGMAGAFLAPGATSQQMFGSAPTVQGTQGPGGVLGGAPPSPPPTVTGNVPISPTAIPTVTGSGGTNLFNQTPQSPVIPTVTNRTATDVGISGNVGVGVVQYDANGNPIYNNFRTN